MAQSAEQLRNNLIESMSAAFHGQATNIEDVVSSAIVYAKMQAQGLTASLRMGIDSGDKEAYASLFANINAAEDALAKLRREINTLRTHRCEYNSADYCTICGVDGRA